MNKSDSITEVLNKIATKEELTAALSKRNGVTTGTHEDGVVMILINPTK